VWMTIELSAGWKSIASWMGFDCLATMLSFNRVFG
jgi:hypothetical protein